MTTLQDFNTKAKPNWCPGCGDYQIWIALKQALVKLDDKPFRKFTSSRDKFGIKTSYTYPGAIQYFGPDKICNLPTKTLILEQE